MGLCFLVVCVGICSGVSNDCRWTCCNIFPFTLIAGGCVYDVIMFDVDCKDPTLGMSCPPPAFVEAAFLEKVRNLLTARGMASHFISHLVSLTPSVS